jgi:hypothetical protein
VFWARELDQEQNAKLLAYFKDRKVWIIDADDDDSGLTPYTGP